MFPKVVWKALAVAVASVVAVAVAVESLNDLKNQLCSILLSLYLSSMHSIKYNIPKVISDILRNKHNKTILIQIKMCTCAFRITLLCVLFTVAIVSGRFGTKYPATLSQFKVIYHSMRQFFTVSGNFSQFQVISHGLR